MITETFVEIFYAGCKHQKGNKNRPMVSLHGAYNLSVESHISWTYKTL